MGRFGDVGRNEYLYGVMKKVRITAIRQTVYRDLVERYENPIEHTCDVREGDSWVSIDGQRPDGLCPSAWDSMSQFVQALARGEGNFYDGWMRNPDSAMISCNDGFRPFSFYIETIDCGRQGKGVCLKEAFGVKPALSLPSGTLPASAIAVFDFYEKLSIFIG